MMKPVSIIGYGNWGASLAHGLALAQIPVAEIVVRGKRRARGLKFVQWPSAALDAPILWLCVPDSAVAEAAGQIAQRRPTLTGQVILHSSGALTADALGVAKAAGARAGSVHPVMSFPSLQPVPLSGVLFGVEAEAGLKRPLYSLVRRLGGRPFAVSTAKKGLYHAAATMASPLLVSAIAAAIETARLAGVADPAEFVRRLAQASSANAFARGPAQAFSGPFARGDLQTIELHLRALHPHPMLQEVYRSLGLHAIHSFPSSQVEEFKAMLTRPAAKRVRH